MLQIDSYYKDLKRRAMLNQSSLDTSKKKYPHSKNKQVYSATFFIGHKVHYIMQTQQNQVIVCQTWGNFNMLSAHKFKYRITCIYYQHHSHILYLGTNKGLIGVLNLKQQAKLDHKLPQQGQQSNSLTTISSIDGEPIIGLFAYNTLNKAPELISIVGSGKMRKFIQKKYIRTIELKFKISKIVVNKTVEGMQDISLMMLKQGGAYPYLLSAQQLINLFNSPQTDPLPKYLEQQQVPVDQDQQIKTQKVVCMALSNSKRLLVISTGKIVTIYTINKNGDNLCLIPDFQFHDEEVITNLDVVDTALLYLSAKGLAVFNVQTRRKIARGLVFKGSEYDIIHWVKTPCHIIYGSTKAAKMKTCFCQLKPTD